MTVGLMCAGQWARSKTYSAELKIRSLALFSLNGFTPWAGLRSALPLRTALLKMVLNVVTVIISDIIDHLVKNEDLNARSQPTEYLANETKPYLDPVIKYFSNLSIEERSQLRRKYSTGGKTEYWRTLQQVIQETRSEFNPEGLEQYKKDSSKQYNTK